MVVTEACPANFGLLEAHVKVRERPGQKLLLTICHAAVVSDGFRNQEGDAERLVTVNRGFWPKKTAQRRNDIVLELARLCQTRRRRNEVCARAYVDVGVGVRACACLLDTHGQTQTPEDACSHGCHGHLLQFKHGNDMVFLGPELTQFDLCHFKVWVWPWYLLSVLRRLPACDTPGLTQTLEDTCSHHNGSSMVCYPLRTRMV